MRSTYVVSYDISDPKRLRKMLQLMRGYGDHVQLSVFRCDLSARELVELRTKIADVINGLEDQVLFVDVGPADGRGRTSFRAMGRPYVVSTAVAVVV